MQKMAFLNWFWVDLHELYGTSKPFKHLLDYFITLNYTEKRFRLNEYQLECFCKTDFNGLEDVKWGRNGIACVRWLDKRKHCIFLSKCNISNYVQRVLFTKHKEPNIYYFNLQNTLRFQRFYFSVIIFVATFSLLYLCSQANDFNSLAIVYIFFIWVYLINFYYKVKLLTWIWRYYSTVRIWEKIEKIKCQIFNAIQSE